MSEGFPRGPGPLVSVLLPTRGRPDHLYQAVASLFATSQDRDLAEYLIKADDDDLPTIDLVQGMIKDGLKGKLLVGPRGRGYLDMHHWVNDMVREAQGDWLFLFNDDARMVTSCWDQVLLNAGVGRDCPWHGVKDVCMLVAPTVGRPDAAEFNFVRRKLVDIMGHYALNPHTDNWIYSVVCSVHAAFRLNVEVQHLSNSEHMEEDDVRREVLKAYEVAGRDLNSIREMRQKQVDVGKLIDYIEAHKERNDGKEPV